MTPQEAAQSFLEEIGISQLPVIPRAICNQLGIVYREQSLKSIDGMLIIFESGASLISVNTSIPELGRKHFTGAHELGHFCMDAYDQSEFHCTREDIENFRKQILPMELRANQFAAELLMPVSLFGALVDGHEPEWDYIKQLAEHCHTTWLATARRFIDITDLACVLIVSKNRSVSWFHPSKKFRAYIDMDSRLISPCTMANLAHQGQIPPDNFELVKADNWVSGRGVTPSTEVLEWTLPRNSYGQVLTLLLDEDGIGGWGKEEYEEDEDDEVSTEWELPTLHKSRRKR